MRKFLSIILCLTITTPSWAALAVDSEMPSNVSSFSADGAHSHSFSFTNTAGTLLVCAVAVGGAEASTIATITYNTVSMGSADVDRRAGTDTEALTAIYHLLSPATGSNTFAITTTLNTGAIIVACISFTGNDTSNPIRTTKFEADGSAATASVSVTGTTSGNIVVANAGGGSDFTSYANTLSSLKNINGTYAINNQSVTRAAGTDGNVTMSSTMSGSDFWAICAVEVQGVTAANYGSSTTGRGFGYPGAKSGNVKWVR